MRYLLLAVTLFTVCAVPARADDWGHTYPVTGKPHVVVDANDGDVEVAVGSSQQVEVRVVTRGLKINDDLQVSGNQSGNRVELKLHKIHRNCFGICNQSIRVEVRVPQESELDINTADGNVKIDGVHGDLQLETKDGEVRVHDGEGLLHASSGDGNMNVDGRFETVSLRTGDGNIDADLSPASTPRFGWMLRTGDGNLHLRLPDNFGADIDAQSGDGRVSVEFPITVSGSRGENSVRGKINGGGIAIELRTGDGEIRVEKK